MSLSSSAGASSRRKISRGFPRTGIIGPRWPRRSFASGAAGAWVGAEDLIESTWDVEHGAARLWLPGTPAGVARAGAPPNSASVLAEFLERLFRRRGRVIHPEASGLLARLREPDAAAMRA